MLLWWVPTSVGANPSVADAALVVVPTLVGTNPSVAKISHSARNVACNANAASAKARRFWSSTTPA